MIFDNDSNSDIINADEQHSTSVDEDDDDDDKRPVKKKTYQQHARVDWLKDVEFKDWVIIARKTHVKCKFCHYKILAKKSNLIDNKDTKKHKAAVQEARLALFVAKHTSINVVDHLKKTVQACFSDASGVNLSRTKCTAIISNVWHPYFMRPLKEDIDGKFSLIVEESTDVGTIKFLGIVIKYFSKKQNTIVATFLKLQEIDQGDADSIVKAIRSVLVEFDLDILMLVGLGTDNANVNTGHICGVYAKLKAEVKHLILATLSSYPFQKFVRNFFRQVSSSL